MARVRFVAVGELMLDVLATGSGHDARISVRAGGSAANAAVWAAECGADATVAGALGHDLAGDVIRAALERRGVEVEASAVERTGSFLVVNGERFAHPSPPPPSAVEGARGDAILVSGYLSEAAIAAALSTAKAPWVALDAARLDRLPDAHCLFVNEERAAALTGLGAEEAAHALAAGRRLVCVTRGARGAVAVLEGRLERAGAPAVAAGAEALGAGDALAAATLVTLSGGATLAEALTAGCRAGALSAASPDGWPVRK